MTTDTTPIRVPPSFPTEFPGARAEAAELAANLVRTVDAFLAEVGRRRRAIASLSAGAFQTLAILEGARRPLEPREIASSLLVTSASMTSLLDTLETKGLIKRTPHPKDRRKVLVSITAKARAIVDRMLPVVHATSTSAFAGLSNEDCERVIRALTSARARIAELSAEVPKRPPARRVPAQPRAHG